MTQDHVNPDLLFAAAEFGLYVSVNGGENWSKLSGNVPTIAFRDLKLHRRDEDLVGASFGRGFYVLDDYTALRDIAEGALEKEAHLFPVRDAWWYVPYTPMQTLGQPTLGSTYFTAENPPFGALITYYVKEAPLSKKEQRHKTEKELREQGQNIPFPSWERLRMEATDEKPKVMLLIRDADGRPLRWLEGAAEAGLQRTNWDLRLAPTSPIKLEKPAFVSPWQRPPQGPMVSPGQYAVELFVWAADGLQPMGEPQSFTVKAVPTAPDGTDFAAVAEFQRQAAELLRRVSGAGKEIERTKNRLKHIKAALIETPQAEQALLTRTHELDVILSGLSTRLLTDEVRGKLNEPSIPTIQERVGRVIWGVGNTRQMPTATQRTNLQIAQEEFEGLVQELMTLIEHELAQLEQELEAAGAPWTPGRKLG